jgi:hypothetical protein
MGSAAGGFHPVRPLATQTVEKALGFDHEPTNPKQFALEIFDVRKAPTKTGLADPPNTGQPNDGSGLPAFVEQF